MTGKEFLEKVKLIKQITDIRWQVKAMSLTRKKYRSFIADGEEVKVNYPKPDDENRWLHEVAIACPSSSWSRRRLRVSLGMIW